MSGDDHLSGQIGLKSGHRSKSTLELDVVRLK